jgi:hypothetical protein
MLQMRHIFFIAFAVRERKRTELPAPFGYGYYLKMEIRCR